MKAVFGTAALVLAALLAFGIVPRVQRSRELEAESASVHAVPKVNVVTIGKASPTSELSLPGSIEAMHESPIYARTPGYIQRWTTDIGAHVAAGQVMALIESPDLDHQVDQAKADLIQLQANLDLAKRTLERWKALSHDSVVTALDVDTKQAAYDVAAGNLTSGQANYRRLQQLQDYEKVTAPFTGVVTSRTIDNGTLIDAGAASNRPLFTVAGTDTVRVYVDVPQSAISMVQPGQKAAIVIRELPDDAFEGTVIRNARALDAASRTLLTEIQIPNPKRVLLPGMYAEVRFQIKTGGQTLVLPANALVVRTEGPEAAVVGSDNTVHYQKLELGRDFGTEVEITSGLNEGARVVVNPSDDIREGVAVTVLSPVGDTKRTR
ncbi:MAG TPA: efflux RND transporter periplasmic adaptor subunit [Gemmatimonadaceae bacterium]|nr:efflux RND transporter periplasmic adaptor subunit [Gemmatimonadaceae bacterium]